MCPARLTVVPGLQLRPCDQQVDSWLAYDEASGRSWRLGLGDVAVLDAVRGGWRPSDPLPCALVDRLAPACEDPGQLPSAVRAACVSLCDAGLVRTDAVGADAAGAGVGPVAVVGRAGWGVPTAGERRVVRLWVPAVPPALRPMVLTGVTLLPLVGLAVALWALARPGALATAPVASAWHQMAGLASPVGAAAILLVGVLGFLLVHELGHAVAMGAATGRRTEIGLRLFYGLPQAYADVRHLVMLPRRRDRLAVLFAGAGAELIVWALVHATVAQGTGSIALFAAATVAAGGPLVALANVCVPFYRTDGYFALQELAGVDRLRARGLEAAATMVAATMVAPADGAVGPAVATDAWWLPWYGLLDIHLLPCAAVALGLALGQVVGAPGVGVTIGALVAMAWIGQQYRALRPGRAATPT